HLWLRPPDVTSRFRTRRSYCIGHCRYSCPYFSGAVRAVRGCSDSDGWRAILHLFAAQEAGMSTAARPIPGDPSRTSSEVRLSVEQVSYAYAANPAQAPLFTLEATSFQAKPGELVAILGPNASGKSTLLKLISGAFEPLSGRIFLNGFVT